MIRVSQMRRRGNHHLAGQRDDGAFDRHQEHDDRVTTAFERGQVPRDDGLEDGFEHGRFIAENRVESIRELRPVSAVLPRRTGEFTRIGKAQNYSGGCA